MREILFRGKALDGNWYYGVPLVFTEDYICITAPYTYNKLVITSTVGQFTGLTDKKGKKIFEGDICQVVRNGVPLRGVIEFLRGTFGIRYKTGEFNSFLYLMRRKPEGCVFSTVEVIGNIHDNPELLEVTE